MRLILIIVCLAVGNTVYAQNVSLSKDSSQIHNIKQADSLIKTGRNQTYNRLDSNLARSGSGIKQTQTGMKARVNDKIDSSARVGYKSRLDTEANSFGKRLKAMPRRTYEGLKKELPKGNDLLRFSMTFRSENYATTAQNPMIRSELAYSRLYLSPTFTLLGLPFTSNLFFTTEANNTYKNNFFSFRLDVNALRRLAEERMRKEVDETRKLDRMRQIDLNKNALETKQYQYELDQLKNQIPDYSALDQQLKEQIESRSKQYLDNERANLEAKLKNASEDEKKRLQMEYEQKADSVKLAYRQRLNDSMSSAKSVAGSEIDTSKLNRLLRLQSKIERLESKRKSIERLRQMDTAGMASKVAGIRNPDQFKKMADGRIPGKGLLSQFIAVDRFGVGLIAPTYSEFTLQAASVKGLDIGVSKQSWYYDVSLGKMSRQFTGPFSAVKPQYDRNLAMARLGLGNRNKEHIAVQLMSAFDSKVIDSLSPMINNAVVNLDFKYIFMKSLSVEGDLAQSSYREYYNSLNIKSAQQNSTVVFSPNASRAYRLKAVQQAGKNTQMQVEGRQIGAAFKSMGNPFLRRNFREIEAKVEQKFWKQKILLQANYKEMRDNLLELNKATNRLKGWGIKLQTSFEKLPNITFSHSPYQQGNNHPDSLYRTNNQYAITMLMLTYKKRFKGLSWNVMACATRSSMEISGRGPVTYRMMTVSNVVQVGLRHNLIGNYMSNVTLPGVDSLNSNSYQFNYNYLAKKGFSLGSLGEYTVYKSSAFKAGGGLTANAVVLRNLSLSALVRCDRVKGLWHLSDQYVWTGKVIVMWRW